jgi:type IV pilus assembly protein PilW
MKNSISRQQTGLSLVEVMVALFIGLFLLLGLYEIFISSKQSYRLAEAQSRLQENARYALEQLSHDIRLAGYFGCSGVIEDKTPLVLGNSPFLAPNPDSDVAKNTTKTEGSAAISAWFVTGSNRDGSNATTIAAMPSPGSTIALTASLTDVVKETDAITVLFAESCGGITTGTIDSVSPAGKISAANTCGSITAKGTPLVISSCERAHVFRSSTDNTQNKDKDGNQVLTIPDGITYAAGSEILLHRAYTYFIKENTAQQPALYRFDNNLATSATNPMELVEGVEDMDLTYGVDTTGDGFPDQYLDTPGNWTQVASVRVELKMRSIEDNVAVAARNYTYNGTAASDRRLERTFTTTIGVRN